MLQPHTAPNPKTRNGRKKKRKKNISAKTAQTPTNEIIVL